MEKNYIEEKASINNDRAKRCQKSSGSDWE